MVKLQEAHPKKLKLSFGKKRILSLKKFAAMQTTSMQTTSKISKVELININNLKRNMLSKLTV